MRATVGAITGDQINGDMVGIRAVGFQSDSSDHSSRLDHRPCFQIRSASSKTGRPDGSSATRIRTGAPGQSWS